MELINLDDRETKLFVTKIWDIAIDVKILFINKCWSNFLTNFLVFWLLRNSIQSLSKVDWSSCNLRVSNSTHCSNFCLWMKRNVLFKFKKKPDMKNFLLEPIIIHFLLLVVYYEDFVLNDDVFLLSVLHDDVVVRFHQFQTKIKHSNSFIND